MLAGWETCSAHYRPQSTGGISPGSGYYDGNTGLAEGFAEAAEAIFIAWQSAPRSNDRLLLPLVYNYRHALELALKQAIRQAARPGRRWRSSCREASATGRVVISRTSPGPGDQLRLRSGVTRS